MPTSEEVEKFQNITAGNALIATFMGGFLRDMGHGDMIWDHESYTFPGLCAGKFDLKYHSSWDWLMPCVKKIQELKTNDFPKKKPIIRAINDVDIEILWSAVVNFIKLYNQNN